MGEGKGDRQGRGATLRDTSQGVPDVTPFLISFFVADNFTARIGRFKLGVVGRFDSAQDTR